MENKKLIAIVFSLSLILVGAFAFNLGVYTRQTNINFDASLNSFHLTVYLQRAGESEPVFISHHAGVLTTIGKNYIEDQLGDSPGTDSAHWISLSNSTSTPSAAWTQIPGEIVTNGLARASATYASTGDGAWTLTYQWTATSTNAGVQLCGIQWAVSGDNNLLWSDIFTPVNMLNGDKLTIVASSSVS